ncbi:hypothetical protein EH105704_01_02690 [Atlantibacter hermannii NBRC 105704]|uniref:Uncharacterized protein n=1 Tax=Atlantibacter hermannii NBRC 105704 TaxID=1115512 RepID=H5UWI1_ATLHE|nr:hypothetical protein EH105704_01_02690 [Atlantibacter hermannii NBRC 105704]VDZ72965.1 Uncharacterised protein [Atlantibacter hermannii]
MAILVQIRMIETVGDLVTYSYSDGNGREGRFDINASTGELNLNLPMPHDGHKTYFARAARKVITDWRKNGHLPVKTAWAS